MVEAQCSVQITFPVELKGPNVVSFHSLDCNNVIFFPAEIWDLQNPFHRATMLSISAMLAVQMEEVHYTGFICKLLETKIMQVLRFKHGQVHDNRPPDL